MRFSQIKDLLRNPTQVKAETLVRAIGRARNISERNARQTLRRFLANHDIPTSESVWSGHIVIRLSDEHFYVRSRDGYISREEYEVFGLTCDSCDSIIHLHELADTSDGRHYCGDCANRYLHWCNCDECWHPQPCSDCDRSRRGRTYTEGFVNYSTNVLECARGFRHAPDEVLPALPLYMGVELEVYPRRDLDRAKEVVWRAVQGFSVLKYDSSVPDGFEIVSIPATLAWHRQVWPKALESIRTEVRSWSHNSCGMHVHFSLNALTPLQAGKLLVFINEAANQDFVWAVAGRRPSQYAEIRSRRLSDGKLDFRWDHHDALSVSQRNRGETMEMRIFRGNVATNGFLKNLDFVAALVEWSANASIQNLKSSDFIEWMSWPGHQKSYPYLAGWLAHKGYYKTVLQRHRDMVYQEI